MIGWIVGSSVRFRLLVIGGAAAALLIGATQLRHAHVDVLPEFTPPYRGGPDRGARASPPPEVEQLITVPLEQDLLNGVPLLDRSARSRSPGLSSIELIFEPGHRPRRARQVVQERLTQARALPHVSKPPRCSSRCRRRAGS